MPSTIDPALFSGHPAGTSPRRTAERLSTGLWEVFPGHVALLDRDGVVVSVNRAWREFGPQSGVGVGVGANYLAVCARAAVEGEPDAREAADLVSAALQGRNSGRRLSHRSADGRWFTMQAVPIPGPDSGALVVHIDTTPEARLEREWWLPTRRD